MEADAVASLLSGTSTHAPRLCRASLAVVFTLRLSALAVGAKTLWRDEVGDLACNASTESCRRTCFAAAFPISPFSLFALQLAVIFSHALASSWHLHPRGQGMGSWLQPTLRGKQQRLWLHLGSLLAKAVLEGIFLVTFHTLYSHFPVLVQCRPSPCPPAVTCAILNAGEKDAFNHFMAGSSWACLLLSLLGTQHAAVQIFQEASGKALQKGTARKLCV
ncbi:gap junction beta-2 protein-like [Chelonoidis abingdonii]|uniref:gap junction beta-2 protein-like n=1 Tax=Chelonoidis abingdonii TaxID=106734 RepID=UPI0013F28B4C|nr:gap junction beta-2 protein-like [Chelonoidis abingdonii]